MHTTGLEQEFFFVPRSQYNRRPDLQFTGRTVTGETTNLLLAYYRVY